MEKIKQALLCFAFASIALAGYARPEARTTENFDFDWKFILQDIKEASQPGYDDSRWEAVQLPHDWSISLPFDSTNWRWGSMGYLPGGVGWYRKTFAAPGDYKGGKVSILFDGVYHQCEVFINGKRLGYHAYGYTGFEYDLTPHLKAGADNTLAVRVDHSNSPSSRWYSGSGIYRHVWLVTTGGPARVATWGTYIVTPQISASKASVKAVTTLENNTASRKRVSLESSIVGPGGKAVATVESEASIPGRKTADVEQQMSVDNPELWSIQSPNMYRMISLVKVDGEVIDRYETSFGIRSIKFDPAEGFFLNGERVKLRGMNLHQDAGALGTAVPDRSYERRLEILKEYGCNAIRCSHNPPSPEFLDICDRLGFVVIDEAFDKWKSGYYAAHFDGCWQTDLDAMLRRDRNHPSIIIWSVGNEVAEQNDTTSTGASRAKMLQDYVHAHEPTRPVTVVIASADVSKRPYNETGFTTVLDIVGYNYQEPWYDEDKQRFPNRIMFGAEVFPFYRGRAGSVRDYAPTNPWNDGESRNYIFGQFIWAGVDYLGESSGWPSKGWPTCPFDECMFEKPRGAYHRSVWNAEPMVRIAVADQSLPVDPGKDHWSWPHLADHWTFPQYRGHIIQVQTITNCDSVELWVNNLSMGRRQRADYTNNTIVWYVPYRAGKIRAVGYNSSSGEAARYELNTAGRPSRIALSPDRSAIRADGQDLSHITVTLLDDKGVTVPNNDLSITFEVSGAGRLIGLDNGDLRSSEPYKSNRRTTYFGKALAIVQSERSAGDIIVTATSPGLAEGRLVIRAE
jgi:beta-galactosidase